MLPESNPKKSCRGSHHALRLHRNLLQSQAPPLSARLSLPTRVRKTLEQSNKPTKLNNCLSAFSKTDQLVHAVLPYSNWEWARVCFSESYLSLKRGLQSALVELGGCPRFCQSDQSSTATHVRGRSEGQRSGREYNARYLGLLAHYGLEPAVIGVGEPHENGDVESAHGHLRTAIDQALRLAGSRQFASVAQYEGFLFELLRKR